MGTTNALDLNNRVTELEKAVSGGDSSQANKADIATEFNTTTAYTAGCFVYYGGKLYQFNADHAAGAWDPTDVVEANVTDQVVSNKAAIDGLTASDVAYDNTDSGLSATDVQGAIDELVETPRGYKVIATFTGDGVKTYGDVITAFLPYINQVDMLLDIDNVFYQRNSTVYFSFNMSSSGTFVLYAIRLATSNAFWKSINVGTGSETDYISQVVPLGRVIKFCKKL